MHATQISRRTGANSEFTKFTICVLPFLSLPELGERPAAEKLGYRVTNHAHGGILKSKRTTALSCGGICLITTGLIPFAGNAESLASNATLTVIVDGIPSIEGAIKIQVLREAESEPLYKATAPVKNSSPDCR